MYIYVFLMGTGFLSEREGLDRSSHTGPESTGNFIPSYTHIELLRRLGHLVNQRVFRVLLWQIIYFMRIGDLEYFFYSYCGILTIINFRKLHRNLPLSDLV